MVGAEHSEAQPGSILPKHGSAMHAHVPELMRHCECLPAAGGSMLSESGAAVHADVPEVRRGAE